MNNERYLERWEVIVFGSLGVLELCGVMLGKAG